MWPFHTPPALALSGTGTSSLKHSGPVATLVSYDNPADCMLLGTGGWPAVAAFCPFAMVPPCLASVPCSSPSLSFWKDLETKHYLAFEKEWLVKQINHVACVSEWKQ